MGTTGSCDSGGCKQCCEKKCQGPSEMQEYQPQNKKQMLKESVEMHPPAAVKRSEGENALEDVMADSYFARELEELRELMSKGPDGDRPLFTFKSGATYKGQLKGNQRHGFGCQEWPDGAAFTGEWRENYAEGHGQFIHADGDVFIGQWRKSAAEGLGLYVHKHGLTTYRGQWVQDVQHGIGVEEWEGGSRYDGQFYWGKKQGYGVYSWPDGSLYMGQWDSNAINGYGHYMGKDGREFQGLWHEAVIHGCGRYTWPDGRTFQGQYADDQKHGFGTFTWQDGRRFDGFWQHGKQHGYGITSKTDGTVLKEGRWVRGQYFQDPSPLSADNNPPVPDS